MCDTFLQFNLVCARSVEVLNTQLILNLGMIFGDICLTPLSDIFGRKPVFLISHMLLIVLSVAAAFVPTFEFFNFTRFAIGAVSEVRTLSST